MCPTCVSDDLACFIQNYDVSFLLSILLRAQLDRPSLNPNSSFFVSSRPVFLKRLCAEESLGMLLKYRF